MTSFISLENYSPIVVAIAGLVTFLSLLGSGKFLLWLTGLRLMAPWSSVTAVLIGIQALGLIVLIEGMVHEASRFMLAATWVTLVATGVTGWLLTHRRQKPNMLMPDEKSLVPLFILVGGLLVNLAVAVAPSTKSDELYYHMLVPSRILSDGGLEFYRMPWEAAIWPQMGYQISSAPLHAIGYPDAANVVSWALGTMLAWFAWRIIRAHTTPVWASFWTAGLCVGIYPVVWHVTAGAHAMGDLALATAIIAFVDREDLLRTITPPSYAAMMSILLVSAATSKVTLVPLCAVLFALSAWQIFQSAPTSHHRILLAFMAPWILFYCPVLLWTWIHSGSPFGPLLAGLFGPSIYTEIWLRETFHAIREPSQQLSYVTTRYLLTGNSPLVWVGAVGAIFCTNVSLITRVTLAVLLLLQLGLINLLLPPDPRFLGGLQYGLVIVFASNAPSKLQNIIDSVPSLGIACATFLAPWLGIQLYYAKQFLPVSLGFEKKAFYQRYVPFYDDYLSLSRILPQNAVILTDFRLSSVYAPRPVFFDPLDVPKGKDVVLLSPATIGPNTVIKGYRLGDVIYTNPKAVVRTYRTPGRSKFISAIQAIQLYPR